MTMTDDLWSSSILAYCSECGHCKAHLPTLGTELICVTCGKLRQPLSEEELNAKLV